TILEQLFAELGYRDYLGALQRYRVEHPKDMHLLTMSSYLVDYPFANRLYPAALDVLERMRGWGGRSSCPTATSSSSRARWSARASSRRSRATCWGRSSTTRTALPGCPLRPCRRQAANSGCGQERLGRPRDHRVSPAGPVCPRAGRCVLPGGRPRGRTHRRSSRIRPSRTSGRPTIDFVHYGSDAMKATQRLHDLGQSIWLDNITRDLLTGGTLKRYIDELSVTGLTSNPTIFDHAIKNSTSYDASILEKLKEGKSGERLFFELALDDLGRAADFFRPIHDRT